MTSIQVSMESPNSIGRRVVIYEKEELKCKMQDILPTSVNNFISPFLALQCPKKMRNNVPLRVANCSQPCFIIFLISFQKTLPAT